MVERERTSEREATTDRRARPRSASGAQLRNAMPPSQATGVLCSAGAGGGGGGLRGAGEEGKHTCAREREMQKAREK